MYCIIGSLILLHSTVYIESEDIIHPGEKWLKHVIVLYIYIFKLP